MKLEKFKNFRFKALLAVLIFSFSSVSSWAAIIDIGYVGEDETEIEITRGYSKQPTFPRKAIRLGKEGYVVVEFDIDTDGAVLDPYVVVAVPQGVFERAAIKAVRKWVYESPTYNGQSVKANNVQVKLTFSLN